MALARVAVSPNPSRRPGTLLEALARPEFAQVPISIGAGDHGAALVLTRTDLLERAQAFAQALLQNGIRRGDRVFLLLPTGPELLTAMIGTWMSGAAVVIGAPFRPLGRTSLFLEELRGKLATVEPRLIVSLRRLDIFGEIHGAGSMPLHDFAELEKNVAGEKVSFPELRGEDLAVLQFTSGSTSAPKATKIYHYQLVENILAIAERVKLGEGDRVLTWFPLYHDMGLVGGVLCPLMLGLPLDLLPTEAFARDPAIWLKEITQKRPTGSLAPPFALSILAHRMPAFKLRGVDLSSLRFIITGAEPISSRDLDAFASRFKDYGLRESVILPSYGMSEATLAVSIWPAGTPYRCQWIDAASLQESRRAAPALPQAPGAVPVVAVGRPLQGFEVRIQRDELSVGDRDEGVIQIRGPSVTHGYWGQPERDPLKDWVDTGDLGFMVDGEIHVTGRVKDVMKRGGVAYHPSGLEKAAETVPGVRKGRLAAFSFFDAEAGKEKFVLVLETKTRAHFQLKSFADRVAQAVVEICGVQMDEIVIVTRGSVPKTSSGKIQRGLCKELYLRRTLRRAQNPIANMWSKLRRRFGLTGGSAHA